MQMANVGVGKIADCITENNLYPTNIHNSLLSIITIKFLCWYDQKLRASSPSRWTNPGSFAADPNPSVDVNTRIF